MVKKTAFRGISRQPSRARDVAITDNLEVLTGAKGDGMDKALTLRDMQSYGMVSITFRRGIPSISLTPPDSSSAALGEPHAPVNFTATGSFFDIILQWAHAHFNGYAYTEIYRSATDNFDAATRIGTEIGTFFVDDAGLNAKFYYWARFVRSDGVQGPINATAGTYAETAPNISQVMQDLSDTINSGLLAQELAARIALIDAPNTGLIDGLHNEQVSRVQGQNNLQQQIDSIAVGFAVNTFYQPNEPTPEESTEGDRWFDTDDGQHPYLFSGGVWVDVTDQRITNNTAAIQQEQIARITAQDAISTRVNTLQANIEDPTTGLEANALAYQNLSATVTQIGNSLSSNVNEVAQIQAIVGDNYAALQTIKTVTIDPGGFTAQYQLKTDVNGYIAGYGLWNTGATSQFLVNADTFAVGKAGAVSKYPFIIQNGVTYIDIAMIANASITAAKIGSVSADTITTGILNAARIAANSITADKIDSRGLSIKDQNGNIILSSGQQLSAAYISGLGTLALLSQLAYSDLVGTKPPANADNTGSNIAAGIFGQGAFAILSQLTPANISTYIQAASIGTALIQNLAVTNALIANAAISTAKIGDAQVNTLKVAGNSITAPGGAYTASGANYQIVAVTNPDPSNAQRVLLSGQFTVNFTSSNLDSAPFSAVLYELFGASLATFSFLAPVSGQPSPGTRSHSGLGTAMFVATLPAGATIAYVIQSSLSEGINSHTTDIALSAAVLAR